MLKFSEFNLIFRARVNNTATMQWVMLQAEHDYFL